MVKLAGSTATPGPPAGPAAAAPQRATGSSCAAAWALALLAIFAGGCRSHAYRDVYTDKLTAEVRTLEDKLNQADYANHVLRQKLARYEARSAEEDDPEVDVKIDTDEEGRGAADDAPDDVDVRIDRDSSATPRIRDSGGELDIDLGEPLEPDAPLDQDELPPPSRGYPPLQPLPPRAGEFETPPIELGEPLPPGDTSEDDPLPPGQIPTPESARLLVPASPAAVAIHPGLSGRHHHDSDSIEDGLFLVLTVTDSQGRPIRCEEAVSVVVLDPNRSGAEARLGRWNFSAAEVAEKFRETPVPSIQLPILWQSARPAGESVAVFVRVMTPTEKPLETDMLMEFQAGDRAEWTARGLGPHSAQISPESAWK